MKRKTTADDVRQVLLSAVADALDEGKQEARKKPGLTGVRAVATGAVLYTAGRAAVAGRRFYRDRLGGAQNGSEEPEETDDDEPRATSDEDEYVDEEDEPRAEGDEDEYSDEDEEEPRAEGDEDDYEEEPQAEGDEDDYEEEEEPRAEGDEDEDDYEEEPQAEGDEDEYADDDEEYSDEEDEEEPRAEGDEDEYADDDEEYSDEDDEPSAGSDQLDPADRPPVHGDGDDEHVDPDLPPRPSRRRKPVRT